MLLALIDMKNDELNTFSMRCFNNRSFCASQNQANMCVNPSRCVNIFGSQLLVISNQILKSIFTVNFENKKAKDCGKQAW
jgi:hypothetical protein